MNIMSFRGAALFLSLTLLSVSPAFAMPGTSGSSSRTASPAERFAQMDKDASSTLTWEEFHAARPNLNENAFKSIDADHDGAISLAEWETFSSGHGGAAKPDMNSMMKAMGGMRAPSVEGNSPTPSAKPNGPAMPLIMPPAQKDATPSAAPKATMPLIMPPKAEK